jgi:hypothetical protein
MLLKNSFQRERKNFKDTQDFQTRLLFRTIESIQERRKDTKKGYHKII